MSHAVHFSEDQTEDQPQPSKMTIQSLEKQIKLLKEENYSFQFCAERRAVTIDNIRKQKKAAELRIRDLEDEVLELKALLQRKSAALYGVEPEL